MESILYAEVYLVCLIVNLVLVFWTLRKGMSSASEMALNQVLICFCVNFASNILFALVHGILSDGSGHVLCYIFKSLYHFTIALGTFLWMYYAEVEMRSQLANDRRRSWWVLAPAVIPLVFLIINIFTRSFFSFNAEGAYVRGPLFQVQMIYLLVLSLVEAIRIVHYGIKKAEPFKRWHFYLMASYSLCILAAWLLSFIGERAPVICVAMIVELLVLFLGTTVQQISLDRLTQVNNRQYLLSYLNYKLKGDGENVWLLMMDIDYFKTINDTFGHLEGDNALVTVANGLKLACGSMQPRPYIARYGGDEFIVILDAEEATVRKLMEEIQRCINQTNKESRYRLNMSIGAAKWDRSARAKDLIDLADKKLYEIKAARTGERTAVTESVA